MQHARLLLAVLGLQAPAPDPAGSAPPARVVPLRLESKGVGSRSELASAPIDHLADFDGTLHVWTKAEGLDLRLRIEDLKGKLLAEDEDSGGGKTPYVALVVTKGQGVRVSVGGAEVGAVEAEDPELHLVPAPEDAATRGASERARTELERISELERAGSRDAARSAVTKLVDELVDVDEDARSELVAAAMAAAGKRANGLGAPMPAAKAWGAALRHREIALNDEHPELQSARHALAFELKTQGDLAGARALLETVVAVRTRTLPADHVDLAMAQVVLAETIGSLGELATARGLEEKAIEVLERALPEDDVDLLKARLKHAATIRYLGDFSGARAMQERVLEALLRVLPADHVDLQDARSELGLTRLLLGDSVGARQLFEQVLETFDRTLPEDHPYVATVEQGLSSTLYRLGDLAGARRLQEKGLERFSSRLPDDHPDLQVVRSNLATTMMMQGDLAGARSLLLKVVEVRTRILPDDHRALLISRNNLASVLVQLGDLAGARAIQERVLESCTRAFADDQPDLQSVRSILAATLRALGDLARARELLEKILEVNSRTLPDDHLDLQNARISLSSVLYDLGDFENARTLQEKVLEIGSSALPSDHPLLQTARSCLAATLLELGDLASARGLLEDALEVVSRTLPPDHPTVQLVRSNLGSVLGRLGDLQGARALQEQALEAFSRTLPDGHLHQQRARQSLAWTLAALGEREPAERLALELARARRDVIGATRGVLAPRELEEQVATASAEFSTLVSMALGAGVFDPNPEMTREAFSLVESARAVGLDSVLLSPALQKDPRLAELRAEETRCSSELVRLAQSGAGRDAIHAARQALDLARNKRRAILSSEPGARATMVEPTLEKLSASLAADQALIGYWRAKRQTIDRSDRSRLASTDCMFAFVVRPGAKVSLVDLGPIEAIETAVDRWRERIFARVERGVAADSGAASDGQAESGNALRALVFDPLEPALGDARRLIVALDDALHAVPLDALPRSEGLLGERFAFEQHLSLRELLWPKEKGPAGSELLVALGGPSFNAEPEAVDDKPLGEANAHEIANAPSAAQDPDVGEARDANPGEAFTEDAPAVLRAGPWERGFEPLPQTLTEARGVGALYEDIFEKSGRAVVLEKREASHESLAALAPHARYLHLATHGWFASESVPSIGDSRFLDAKLGAGPAMSLEQQVRGSSPMVLCGLALAGANLPKDQLGRVRGLITAEEIASLDLSDCDLAVLSACDTNVGVRRAGQGVASLQKALHMAGAWSVITSLWKVPDEATKELMLDFYRRLWVEKKPKSVALWEAKMKVRRAQDEQGRPRHSTRDWAAWVLTGNPD